MVADGEEYGAEEAEDEEEEEGGEAAVVDPDAMVDDSEMAGAEGVAAGEESDDGSEDLEAESSGSEDELEEEEEEGEGEGEGDGMEVDTEPQKPAAHGTAAHVDSAMAH